MLETFKTFSYYLCDCFCLTVANINTCESDGKASHAPVAAAAMAVGAATEALTSPSLPLTGEISPSSLYQPGMT